MRKKITQKKYKRKKTKNMPKIGDTPIAYSYFVKYAKHSNALAMGFKYDTTNST